MILENFKSYAGVQEIGPFHKRFSSIVGPNGSGKSNVIDALLFVFGKRAKQLRLNKVSELIHKSSGFPNLEYARVSVHFQLIVDDEEDDDAFEIVPDSEFIVTRTATSNNQSKYTVDGTNKTYTEIGLLLREYGIDLDNNRFLILQGEVEQIAMMKPKAQTPHEEGLLEYLEDIIGSNRFVEKIEEISKSLDVLNEQRLEKVNRLKLAEKERDNLSDSKQDAEIFMEKEKDIRRKKNVLYQINESIENANADDFKTRRVAVNEKLEKERGKLLSSEHKSQETEKLYQQTLADYNAVAAELQLTTSEFGAYERRDVKLQEDMKHCKAQLKKIQQTVNKDLKKEEEHLKDADQALLQIESARKSLVDINACKGVEEAKLEEIMEGLQEATKELRASLEVSQSKLADAERAIASLQIEKESVSMSIKLLQSRAENATKSIAALEEKVSKANSERSVTQLKITGAGKEKADIEAKIVAIQREIDSKVDEEVKLQSKLRNAVTAAEEAKATVSLQQGAGGRNSITTSLLKAARPKGPLANAGIRGRLGDLATISPEYDIAISTACGMLDHIVVDTAEGGQQCINYLREMNGGRASFIPLDQMVQHKSRMEKPFATPQGTSRLFDLIQTSDAALLPAFYLALNDTLVAAELDAAVKVAYVGDKAVFRVVTKDGNLIDTSGAMSGGGKEVRSGGMIVSKSGKAATSAAASKASSVIEITAADIQQLEQKVTTIQDELNACRNTISSLERELKELKNRIKSMPTEIEKMKMAVERYCEQETELQERISVLVKDCQLSVAEAAELKSLNSKLVGIEAQIVQSSPNLTPLKTEVASLQRRILDVGGPKLARAQDKVNALASQFEALSSQLSTREVEESNSRKQSAKAAAARVKNDEDMVKIEEKYNALVAEQSDMETDALRVMGAVEDAKSKMSLQEEQLKAMTKEYDDIKNMLAKIKRVEVDLVEEIESLDRSIRDSTENAKKWKAEAEAIRRLHVDEQQEFYTTVQHALASSKPSSSIDGNAIIATSPIVEALELDVLPILNADLIVAARHDIDEIKREINLLEIAREKLKKDVNMSALLEYLKKDASYKLRLYELEAITETRNHTRKEFEELRRQRLEEFMAGFGIITLKLKEMYQMITLGGDAELELVDSLDPFSEGIVFSVRPPKKSWKNISNLSGGEKTLSSLSLVFALHHFRPTPLYVMDEIDAALDFKNVSIVANYIKERTKNAQFVIISLRNNMFELADRLVGIYKTHDTTKSITINPKMFQQSINGNSATVKSVANTAAMITENRTVLGDTTNKM